MEDHLPLLSGDRRIRLIIFLFSGLCGGLPALIWASGTLRQHHRLTSQKSILLITLLFNNAVELLLTLFIIVLMLSPPWPMSHLICSVFFLVRFLGLHFHQLVALEGIVSLTHPRCSTLLSCLPCYMALTLTMVLSVTLAILYPHHTLYAALFVVPAVVTVTTCVLVRSVRISPQRPTLRDRPERMVVATSLVTLLGLYGPSLLTLPISHSNGNFFFLNMATAQTHDQFASEWDIMTLSVMSLRVIADPLLCVQVCRLPRRQLAQDGEAAD